MNKLNSLSGFSKVKNKVLIGNKHYVLSLLSILTILFLIFSRPYLDLFQFFSFLNLPAFFYSNIYAILYAMVLVVNIVGFGFLLRRIEVNSGGVALYKRSDVERRINKGEIQDVEFLTKISKINMSGRGNKYTCKFRVNLISGEKIDFKTRGWSYPGIKKDFESNGYILK